MEKKEDRWCKLACGSGAEKVTLVVHLSRFEKVEISGHGRDIHRCLNASGRRTSMVIESV